MGRKLTDKSWKDSQKHNKKDNVYSFKHLFHQPKEKLKPQFTFADVAKHAAKKPRGNNRASKTTTSELQNYLEITKVVTIYKKFANTNTTNLIQYGLSIRFMEK